MNKPSLSLRSLHAAPYEILGLYGALVMDPKRKPTIPSKLSASLKLFAGLVFVAEPAPRLQQSPKQR
jgi:hypothetical protein